MQSCRHNVKYYSMSPRDDSISIMHNLIVKTELSKVWLDSMKELFDNMSDIQELSYEQLSEEDKSKIDNDLDAYSLMRCSEHCGDTVREVQ